MQLPSSYRPFLKPAVFIGVGILLVLLGYFLFKTSFLDSKGGVEIVDTESGLTERSGVTAEIIVEVTGAVNKPGVYKFAVGARVNEAIISAGGLTSSANMEFVNKSINRAAKLIDGQKIYIPDNSEKVVLGSSNSSSQGLININGASQSELESLPGIGPVTAEKIINLRPYSDINELTSRKAVSAKVFEEIKDKVSLY